MKIIKFWNLNNNNSHEYLLNNQCKDYEEYDYIDKLNFDSTTNRLYFVILRYTKKPKITRYIQKNYERIPIYGKYSVKTKKIKEINKVIIPKKFLEEELLNISDISHEMKIQILECISCEINDYIPEWFKKENDIKKIENQKNDLSNIIINDKNKISNFKNKLSELERNVYLTNDTKKTKSSSIKLILGILLLPVIVGIFLLLTYTTKNKANRNIEDNKKAILEFENYKSFAIREIKKYNNLIFQNENKINKLEDEILFLKNKKIEIKTYEDGFIDLRKSLNFSHKEIIKGVYIIWNKTKNKYYVGQSKDINNRIFKQHFKKGDVANIVFAKDWFEQDDFCYKIIPLETKDELDQTEREYILKYNSFVNGYNSTSGNK